MVAAADTPETYRTRGYAVVRKLFTAAEIAELSAALDTLHAEGIAHGRPFRHGNLFYKVAAGPTTPVVQMVQWPAWAHPALAALRLDRRFAAVLAPLIGDTLKQIIHQVHWKARAHEAGGAGSGGDFAWHQDSRSRRPPHAFRNLAQAYVQTGLAIDPHTAESGCLQVIPGSHMLGDLDMAANGQVLGRAITDADLEAVGIDPATKQSLLLEPGDLALWSPFLVHASGPNHAAHARRLIINGYVRSDDCDRGEWAFRAGQPVPLGAAPALVHYEALNDRPDPHYP